MAYLITKGKSKRSKVSRSLFYPLSIVELEVEHQNLREIHRIKEAKSHLLLNQLPVNPIKGSICIFLAEFLSKVLKEVQSDKLLFEYILQSLQVLDLSEEKYANFHLVFMIRISRFLGFYPDTADYQRGNFFDLQLASFVRYKPVHNYFLNPEESVSFHFLLRMDYKNMHRFRFSRHERQEIVRRTLEYYRLHLSYFSDIKSLDILHEIFG